MKRTLFLSVPLLFFGLALHAQSLPPTDKEPAWVMRNDSVVGELVLDTAQRRALNDVEVRYQRDVDDVLANDTMTEATSHARLSGLSADREASIKKVMTPAQFKEWQRLVGPDPADKRTSLQNR